MNKQLATLLAALLCLLAPPVSLAAEPELPHVDALSAAVLMEAQTGTLVFSKDADADCAVAGLSKLPAILTLAQAFDEGLIAEQAVLQVSSHAASIAGPTAFLEGGEQIAASELIKAAVMISAGDAIIALGEHAFGSESVFCDNINVTLRQLGLNKTITEALCANLRFSPRELAVLGAAAQSSRTFSKYCALYLDRISHPDGRETELVNANRLLKNYSGCGGLLTGSSATDGYSGVFSVKRGETGYIAVVIGAQSAVLRTAAAVAILDYGFKNFRAETLAKAQTPVATAIPVRDGNVKAVDLVPEKTETVVLKMSQGKLTKRFELPEYLEAPLLPDAAVGSVIFSSEAGETVATVQLYPARAVEAFGMRDILLRIAGLFVA